MRKSMILASTFVAVTSFASIGQAAVVLNVNLNTPNQITISATTAASLNTVSGSDVTGFYMENFYPVAAGATLSDTLVTGNLVSFLDPSDSSPDLFRTSGDRGLNVWDASTGSNLNFTAGVQAFKGVGTWNVPPAAYLDMLPAAGTTGVVYFPADDSGDIANATRIGEYSVAAIPEPTTLAAVAAGGLVALRRRRA